MVANRHEILQIVKELEDGFRDHIENAGPFHVRHVLAEKVPSKDAITAFLKYSRLYDVTKKRWTRIPHEAKKERQLHYPFMKIFNDVISYFGYSSSRQVRNLLPEEIHVRSDRGVDWNMPLGPNIFLSGSGSNFGPSHVKGPTKATDAPNYQFCTSPCAVRTATHETLHIIQKRLVIELALYARQCFVIQGNRHFVYSLGMTEDYVQLYRFDRGGALEINIVLDIHRNALDFVRCILLVCSPDDAVLGFDTSVFWENDHRFISTIDAEGAPIRYALVECDPVFCDDEIRGRGTVCWEAVSEDATPLLIKDAWRSESFSAEWKMLLDAKGLEGVVQMVSYEEGALISEMRGRAFPDRPFGCWSLDRIRSRVTLVAYGNSIDEFETREQFLYAFRDAVAGHRNLWNRNILHRDISYTNILLGGKDALPGWRGVLIDLDMAIKLELHKEIPRADHEIGTQFFQSFKVLQNAEGDNYQYTSPSHDHLADLESFFYVLCYICLSYQAPHKCVIPRSLKLWNESAAGRAYAAKRRFQDATSEWIDKVTPYFGDIFQKLLLDLHAVLDVRRRNREYWESDDFEPTVLKDIVDSSKQDYERYLACVDEAIASLKKEDLHANQEEEVAEKQNLHQEKEDTDTDNENADEEIQRAQNPLPTATGVPSDPVTLRLPVPLDSAQLNVPQRPRTNLKRRAEHLEEGEENTKRRRS